MRSLGIRSRRRDPYNFEDGLKVRGRDIEQYIHDSIADTANVHVPFIIKLQGDGTTVEFDLTDKIALATPGARIVPELTNVFIGGIYQDPASYSFTNNNTKISFTEAPVAPQSPTEENVSIVVQNFSKITLNEILAELVDYKAPNIYAQERSAKDKLDEYVTAKDFGLSADTVQNLYSIIGKPGQKFYALGYYAPGDGGGGIFYWDETGSETNNGGTIIKPTALSGNGRWKRVYSGLINIKWFGAKVDGSTDDTTSVQNALNVASIIIPDGVTIISSVTITTDKRMITGQSKNAVLKRKNLTYLPLILVNGVNYFNASAFTIDGNKSGCPLNGLSPASGGAAISLDNQGDIVCRNGSYAHIREIVFVNSYTSPAMLYNMISSVITQCVSIGHAREGFYIVSGYECSIDRCISRGDSALPWSLIATQGLATDTWSHKHVISNNICYDSSAAFLSINTIANEVYGNVIGKAQGLSSTGPGIRLGHDIVGLSADRSRVHDNYIFGIADVGSGGTGRGISIENADGCEIFDNRILSCRVGIGASVTQNSDFIIRDNNVVSATSAGYDIFNVINASIFSNIAKSCPTGFILSGQNCQIYNNFVGGASTIGYDINGSSGLNTGHVFDGNKTDSITTTKWNVQTPGNHTFINNEYGSNGNKLITISGATPSVAEGNAFLVNNASAMDMTFLSDWREGYEYTLLFANGNTTLKQSGSFRLKGNADVTPSAGKIIKVLAWGSLFYEVSRSF